MAVMDISRMLDELRARRDQIEAVIIALARLNTGERRGRPPKWLAEAKRQDSTPEGPRIVKRTVSSEARQRMAEAQKRRWAAQRRNA